MSVFHEIKDFLFPIKCSNCKIISKRYLCDKCKNSIKKISPECLICRKKSEKWEIHNHCKDETHLAKVFYFYYYNEVLHNLILSIKYVFYKDKIRELVNLLNESEEFRNLDLTKYDFITYIPMSKKRENWRGFNQTKLIAEYLAQKYKMKIVRALIKIKNTHAQIDLDRESRLKNLDSSFSANLAFLQMLNKSQKYKILIIDDICTTGSTLIECAKTLKHNLPNFQIDGMCLARGENK